MSKLKVWYISPWQLWLKRMIFLCMQVFLRMTRGKFHNYYGAMTLQKKTFMVRICVFCVWGRSVAGIPSQQEVLMECQGKCFVVDRNGLSKECCLSCNAIILHRRANIGFIARFGAWCLFVNHWFSRLHILTYWKTRPLILGSCCIRTIVLLSNVSVWVSDRCLSMLSETISVRLVLKEISRCFFSGNTPLHLAVMLGHRGKSFWK